MPRKPVERCNTITVVDFETASSAYFSACAMGIVLIDNGQIVDKLYFLIQPPENYYEQVNIDIHDITPEQTADADSFPEVWEKIKDFFKDTYVAAHNANFDMSVLKATLDYYDIEQPNFEYMDTMQVSSRCIPWDVTVGKSLVDRCIHFNISYGTHHNALCDAEAAANLIIYAFEHNRYTTIGSFVKVLAHLFDYESVKLRRTVGFAKFRKIDVKEIAATTAVAEKDDDFCGKTFVFTGELKKLNREQALAKVVAGGGNINGRVAKKVDVLVNANEAGVITGSVQQALDLQAKGHHIKIVTEEQFMRMLESTDAISLSDKLAEIAASAELKDEA